MKFIYYLCDYKACSYRDKFENQCDYCHHTAKVEHARNGACKNPENHPERFEVIENNIKDIIYIEREEYTKDATDTSSSNG